jgi:ribosomal protein S27E
MPAFIDSPTGDIEAWSFRVLGWVAAHDPVHPVRLDVNGHNIVPFLSESPPLAAALREFSHVRSVIAPVNVLDVLRPADGESARPRVCITLGIGRDAAVREVAVHPELWRSVPEQVQLQAQTRAWCLARLRCPVCRNEAAALSIRPDAIVCSSCGSEIPQCAGAIDMLPPVLRRAANLAPATHVSANPYEELARDLIGRTTAAGGWVLDCGAGSRPARLPGVVNVEIEDYFSTDVLAVGDNLPFRNGVFDAAVSLAVLEHVRDPFACARDLLRVVKPGGELVCSVPFLQPVHGYPDHYYNMTRSGLINLFGGEAEVVDCLTPPNGHPIFAVQWILREYLHGLPEPQRSRFGAMTIAQAAELDPALTLPEGFATQLGDAAIATIACLNTVRLRRRTAAAERASP